MRAGGQGHDNEFASQCFESLGFRSRYIPGGLKDLIEMMGDDCQSLGIGEQKRVLRLERW